MVHGFGGHFPEVAGAVFIASNSDVSGDVVLGKNVSVWYSATIRGDVAAIRIGDESNIQDGAVLHVAAGLDCVLGQGVTVGHAAVIHACTVGDFCLIGMGAIVLDGAEIGPDCIVGAGSLVTSGKKFERGSMIVGSPAKAVRQLTQDEIAFLRVSAARYVELARLTACEVSDQPSQAAR